MGARLRLSEGAAYTALADERSEPGWVARLMAWLLLRCGQASLLTGMRPLAAVPRFITLLMLSFAALPIWARSASAW